ncbi:MAG: gluconate 2-dehydrogenase subunit 3 family protein [Myxococcota bacterium]
MSDSVFETPAFTALLDTLVPPSADGRLPGAGQTAMPAYLAERAADLAPVVVQALAALDERAAERDARSFAALAPVDRAELLAAQAETDPGLLPGLLFHVYTGYYQQQAVVEALGLEHRPPFPLGYPMEPVDPQRLRAMKARPPLYRDV